MFVDNRTINFLDAAPPLHGSNSTNTLVISWVTASLQQKLLPWQPLLSQAADPAEFMLLKMYLKVMTRCTFDR